MTSNESAATFTAPARIASGNLANGQLKWRIRASLKHRIPDLADIHVTVVGNTVALRGKVRSCREKRCCIECCRHVPGVARVLDDLAVVSAACEPAR